MARLYSVATRGRLARNADGVEGAIGGLINSQDHHAIILVNEGSLAAPAFVGLDHDLALEHARPELAFGAFDFEFRFVPAALEIEDQLSCGKPSLRGVGELQLRRIFAI